MKRPCFFYHEIKRGIFQKGGTMLREKTKEIKIGDSNNRWKSPNRNSVYDQYTY